MLRIVEMTAAEEEELRASHGGSENPDELVDDQPDLDQAHHSSTRLSHAPDLYVGDDQVDDDDRDVIVTGDDGSSVTTGSEKQVTLDADGCRLVQNACESRPAPIVPALLRVDKCS